MTSARERAIGSLPALPTGWRTASLHEFVFFQEGPGLRKWQWTDVGMKVINVTNILADGSIDVSNTDRHISGEEFEEKYSHFAVEAGDVVVASSGNTYGKVGRISQRHLPLMMNTSVIRFHPLEPKNLNADFLYAFLRSHLFRDQVEQFVIGSAQPNFGPTHLKAMSIVVPPLAEQDRIASILSAYDDLIENNTRRIKILEEMAQRIYREWFVHFRFPGHEKVKMVESELGAIPKGWRVSSLRDATSLINRGISPMYDDSADGIVINQRCIREHRLSLVSARRQSKAVPLEKLVRKGDILVNSTGVGTLGRLAQVHHEIPNCTVDSHVTIVRPSMHPDYLGHVALQLEQHFESSGVGSTGQTELARGRIAESKFVCPPETLQAAFAEQAAPINSLTVCLSRQNQNLRTTRDLLLPKLISGEISVEAAEEQELAAAV